MPAASLQEPEKASPIALCHHKKQLDTIEYCTHKLTQRIYTTNIYLDITCSVCYATSFFCSTRPNTTPRHTKFTSNPTSKPLPFENRTAAQSKISAANQAAVWKWVFWHSNHPIRRWTDHFGQGWHYECAACDDRRGAFRFLTNLSHLFAARSQCGIQS